MKSIVQLTRSIVLLCLVIAGAAQAQDYNVAEADGQGVIQGLDFGANTAFVSGTDYQVSPNVRVEIGGSYGAFTMLQEGMSVVFTYLDHADGQRTIIDMREVAEVEGI